MKTQGKVFALLLILGFALSWSSCKKEDENGDFNPDAPAACFEMADSAKEEQPVTIKNCSDIEAVSYKWDFGDGMVSTGKEPQHIYSKSGEYTVTLTVYNKDSLSNKISHKIKITKSAIFNHYFEIIEKNTTFEEGIHIFWNTVYVKKSTLTILPGTILKFKQRSGLEIGSGDNDPAAIIAQGTEARPIIFTADSDNPVPGSWEQIRISDGNTLLSSLKYCEINYGGENFYNACVSVGDGNFEMQHCKISNSGSSGIEIRANSGNFIINNNTFTNCKISSISTTPNMAAAIGLNNIYDTKSCILISAFDDLSAPAVTWKRLAIPYRLEQSLKISSETGSTLTLEPGVEVQIDGANRIDVGSSTGKGRLMAEGTSEKPVVFSSALETKTPGSWNGININNSTDLSTSFKYCKFEYGGYNGMESASDPKGMIHVRNKSINIEYCTFENYHSPAIYLDGTCNFETCNHNTFNAPDQSAIHIHPNAVHTIGLENTFNVVNGVVIYGGTMTHENVTWNKLSCPYILTGNLNIAAPNENTTGSKLTIAPGTTIKMSGDVSIIIGGYYLGSGSLIADGKTEKITFTKYGTYNWNSIYFYKALPGTILNNCIIEYGGSKKFDGAVHISFNNNVTITNNIIRYSAYYGISYQSSNPTLSGNQLIDNAKPGIDVYY